MFSASRNKVFAHNTDASRWVNFYNYLIMAPLIFRDIGGQYLHTWDVAGIQLHDSTLSVLLANLALSQVIRINAVSQWIEKYLGKTSTWQNAKESFEKRGGVMIYLTRWLITPLAIPTNLIAGSSGYSFSKMLVFDVAGELTWICFMAV